MSSLIPLLAGIAILFIGARIYPNFLVKLLGVNDANPTPAHRLKDGAEYVPSPTHVVFGHHFATIAGASPIVGPTLALAFGYGASWLWIILGCIFFGAVHDMTSMYVSMREDGRSMAELSRRTLGKWGYFLFLAFLVLILTLINAIFLNLSCAALTADYPLSHLKLAADTALLRTYPKLVAGDTVMHGRIGGIATTSVFIITLMAPLIGYLTHRRQWRNAALYVIAAIICVLSVIIGFRYPVFLTAEKWRYIMSAYVFVACWIPVWLMTQPRDFTNVQILYGGILLMVIGNLVMGFKGHLTQAPLFDIANGTRLAGPLWPVLMITIACGAISGFHSIAASGTTVKQINKESDVRRVGYYAMLLEGVMALATMILVATALPSKEYFSIVYPSTGAGNPILAFSIAMGYMMRECFRVPVAIGAVIGILVVEGFVVTTLDTAIRLCRYILEELWFFIYKGKPEKIFRMPVFNTALSVGLMLFFALNTTIMNSWKIFGAGNQLIAALALIICTVWLWQRRRAFWFALIPAAAMTATTFAMLILFIVNNMKINNAGPLAVSASERLPLLFASYTLLILAVGVVAVSVGKFFKGHSEIAKPSHER
ncbi:MAG TPA: carbon starvation CstA family protein [Candidatus Sumerlaeota bacterium]|nr:carbon starvation CstA family protein [Candidatus Sumerlaeota bacterium]HRR31955.1 carbon starvation CstA family protein [Candidatus Sumerlaeia bacterium]HON49472.1 carbon starvation CstA family protein [Candidatus Sumerlaeota bacterium]HOR64621.1 carbon starvation CstA family protein [Candidatus Sumerlaeota bacterium]HPL74365.1 carbon starvation CstA family protein [Candidatus Sumerlaeota bacterium]